MKYKASLILSFYRKLSFAKPVIDSLAWQSEKDFEVIIADDGSPESIFNELLEYIDKTSLNYKHVWHEDSGFRKNQILNEAIKNSESEILIFIDGDCILHPKFIEEHVKSAEPGVVRAGRRVNLSERVSNKILASHPGVSYYGWPILFDLAPDLIGKKTRDLEQGIYVKNLRIRSLLNDKHKSIKGCNFSLKKKDLLAVNGFDERFQIPTLGEDTDLEARLQRNGMKFKGIKNQAIQYHLYHKPLPRVHDHKWIYDENNENAVTYTPYGIKKSQKESNE